MKRLLIVLTVALLAAPAFGQSADLDQPTFLRATGQPVPGQYIVVFNDGVNAAATAQSLAAFANARVEVVWTSALNGALLSGLNERQARNLATRPSVRWVEEDAVVTLNATQTNATWGLDRVDQRALPLSGTYTYNFDGSGIHAYIIDTGIRASHNDFGGRASADFDSIGDGQNGNDCNGHGTHVAGTVGGSTWGVAKNVRLHGVRVLNCSGSGTTSGVISGVDWVRNNHISPAVANMSLGGGASSSLDTAVNNAVAAGVFFAVAAGNENTDACTRSPARAANAYTVASSTSSDSRSSFSNWGSCVDIFAPGSSITSAWYTSNTATNTISGTSMASPHVAGAAALILDENPGFTPSQVGDALTDSATCGVISGVNGSPNLLLYTLGGTDPNCGSPPPPPPPGGCPTGYQEFNASISSGGTNIHDQGSASGSFNGILTCSGADLDLYLDKESCSWWSCGFSAVASSTSVNCNEEINYSGTSGTYRWRVFAYSGSTSYTLCTNKP